MPRVSEFFGIVIAMYYNDHAPPHFHAKYAEHESTFSIDTLVVLEGHCRVGRRPSSWSGRLSTARSSRRTGISLVKGGR